MTLFSPVGSLNLASPTPLQASDLEKRTPGISGRRCLGSFERFGHVGLWAKTFSALLIGTGDWFSTRCNLTWKLKGTKYKRLYFQLAPSTPRIEEIGSGLLPTPRAKKVNGCDLNSENLANRNKGNLEETVAKWITGLFPTPAARDYRSSHAENSPAFQNRMQHSRGVALTEHIQREANGAFSQLNPRFVGEMMGFPPDWTELPFLNGETNQSKQQVTL